MQVEATTGRSLIWRSTWGVPRGDRRIYGPESSRQDNARAAYLATLEVRRRSRFHRRRARARPVYAKAQIDIDSVLISGRTRGSGRSNNGDAGALSAVDVVVVDSVAALVPGGDREGDMGDSFVGLQARLM